MRNFYLRLLSSLLILPIFLYLIYLNSFHFYFILFLILIFSFIEIFKTIKQTKLKIILFFLIIIFLIAFYFLRGSGERDFIYCIWFLTIVWLSDTGGYFFGKFFGGKKMTIYSPNKTISGLLGSLIFSQFSILVLIFFDSNFQYKIIFFIIQFFLTIVSIIGDIFFSYIKRKNQIKDYSNLIPGHGGILDRIDGLIFVVIFSYIIKVLNVY